MAELVGQQDNGKALSAIGFDSTQQLNDAYQNLNPCFLAQSQVTALQRFTLKSWILQQMQIVKYSRETYTAASKYLDAYLMSQSQGFPITSLQNLGIACWILAAKYQGQKVPPIDFKSYDQNSIWAFEQQIFSVLDYRLQPPSYPSLAYTLLEQWHIFTSSSTRQTFNWVSMVTVTNFYHLLDILDCLDLVAMGYNFKIEKLVLNVFFLSNGPSTPGLHSLECLQTCKKWKTYRVVFQFFVKYLCQKCQQFIGCSVAQDCLSHVLPFMALHKRNYESSSWESKNISLALCIQTLNRDVLKLARRILNKTHK